MGTLQNEFKKLNLFVKFTKDEYVNDILDGKLYMKNFKHFIDLEKKEKIKGQGDKFEAAFVTRAVDLRIIDLRTKKVIGFHCHALLPIKGIEVIICKTIR
ncbi:hypothetical protein [Bacillus velezensis]|uniref:hypothetical protein n=1 Tax=Bacillus velezensis TaxID=492670 RepID=UPI000E223314|nr:hypothetical protein [Bacillus velezensis]QHQ56270.1 hypothetical protein GWK37_03445 [Bacillus velezensis]RDY87947.1 hypothetical protein C3734_06750 [Bacillus velezensis]